MDDRARPFPPRLELHSCLLSERITLAKIIPLDGFHYSCIGQLKVSVIKIRDEFFHLYIPNELQNDVAISSYTQTIENLICNGMITVDNP